MIGYLEGKIVERYGNVAIILCGGVGYEVWWAGGELEKGVDAKIWVYTHMTEKTTMLFGFEDTRGKSVFMSLLKVGGVGPKTAFSVVSTLGVSGTMQALADGSVSAISSVSGVGQKVAKRIVSEIKGEIIDSVGEPLFDDAENALVNLGYKKGDISKVLKELHGKKEASADLQTLIREAIKRLNK